MSMSYVGDETLNQKVLREKELEEVADKEGLKILGRIIVLIIMGLVMFAGGAKYSGNNANQNIFKHIWAGRGRRA